MKIIADRGPLLAALQRAARIADRRGTMPILTHCLLQAGRERLTVVATDMDREVAVALDAQVAAPGGTTVNARLLSQFVAGLADGLQVELQESDGRLTVRAGRARATFPSLPVADFPHIDQAGAMAEFEVEGAAFATLLRSVAHAQSNEETRYYLRGVCLQRRGDRELLAVATDGHRLARTVLPMAADLPAFGDTIVPTSAIEELASLAEDAGTLAVAISGRLIRAEAGDTVFASKLVDGTFPDHQRVTPGNDIETGFETDRQALVQAVKRVGVFVANDVNKSKPLKLSPDRVRLELLASAEGAGEIADEIDASATTRIPIGMNGRYLAAALDALAGKTVRVRYADAGAPIVFTDPADPHRLQIVMALRV